MHYCTLKGGEGKRLDVQSQIYKRFSQESFFLKIASRNSIFAYCYLLQKSDLLNLTGDLDHKL